MNNKAGTFFLSLLTFSFISIKAQVINTIAGNGASTYAGDGGPAINASMSEPEGVTIDAAGNIFIVDEDNNVIRKVNTSGIISTFAGTGTIGYSGNGGAATSATLNSPSGAVIDRKGNLFIADTWNNAIRKVDTAGKIWTVAGNGIGGYSGDNGQATLAHLNLPEGIAVDPQGNLYICDSGNNCVRKVDTSGIITTIAGTGAAGYGGDNGIATSAGLNYPSGIVFDTATGNIYVADESNNRIRRIDTNGLITTFAGTGTAGFGGDGGLATAATLSGAEGVAVDTAGNVYISDSGNSRIRKVTPNGVIHPYAGSGVPGFSGDGGPALAAQLFTPKGIATDVTGNIYIAEYFNSRVRKISVCATPLTVSITGTDTICLGDSITLHASGALTYSWSANADSAIADSVIVKPSATTTFSVAAVNGLCAAVDSFQVVVVTCPSGIRQFENAFSLYPNPAQDKLYVQAPSRMRGEMFDSFGRKIKEFSCDGPVDLSALPPGLYYVRLNGEHYLVVKYFVKL